ncbi:hypothetical protein JD969_08720 [Planctomycetota bacterium]|nr:hypothetical protein JD969_08720 [Planctomycetota bacterium]
MKITSVLSLLLTVVLFAGCTSFDRHVYESTPVSLKTITIVKKPSGEPIWSYDVPSGYRLILDFNSDEQVSNKGNSHSVIPTEMNWKLVQGTESDLTGLYVFTHSEESGVVPLPGTPIQQIMTLRSPDGEELLQEKYEIEGAQEVVDSDGKVAPLDQDAAGKEADETEDNTGDAGEQM